MRDIKEVLTEPFIRKVIADLSWEKYKSLPFMNPSTLKHGRKSMLHLLHSWRGGYDKDTPAMAWGRAVHCLLLEPSEFESRFVAYEGRRDERMQVYKDFLAENVGKEVLSEDQMSRAIAAATTVLADKEVRPLITRGKAEVTVFADIDGMQFRGRIDWLTEHAAMIVDVKTTTDAESQPFGRIFRRFGYDISLGLYREMISRVLGVKPPVKVICMEAEAPYDVTVVPVDDAILNQGVRRARKIIADLKVAIATGEFHGVAKGEEYFLDFPDHQMDDDGFEGAEEYIVDG